MKTATLTRDERWASLDADYAANAATRVKPPRGSWWRASVILPSTSAAVRNSFACTVFAEHHYTAKQLAITKLQQQYGKQLAAIQIADAINLEPALDIGASP